MSIRNREIYKPGSSSDVPVDPHQLGRRPLAELMAAARDLRDQGHDRLVTYSRKVFIPLTRLCRDVCHYCTFATMPRHLASPYMTADEAVELAMQGKAMGCKEALFTLGEKPELRHDAARAALDEMGFATTLEYVAHVAKRVLLETGLLPHINAGCMSPLEIGMLRPVSASMGIMLESVSSRLCEKGQVHYRLAGQGSRTAPADAGGLWPGGSALYHRHPDRHRRNPEGDHRFTAGDSRCA